MFTTFSAVPELPQPIAPEEKITRILQNLNKQHDAVRRKIAAMLQARGKELLQKAEEELAGLGENGEVGGENGEARRKRDDIRRAKEQMLKKVRVKAREGSTSEDYEIKPSEPDLKASNPALGASCGDVAISGVGYFRSAATIRQELSHALRDLVDRGVAELEAYDSHAAQSTSIYEQALKRREERRGSTSTTSIPSHVGGRGGGFGGGILRSAR